VTAVTPEVLWTPSAEAVERATLTRFQRWLTETRGLQFEDYQALWRWSVDDLEAFWASIVEFFDVRFEDPPRAVLGSEAMPGAEWFPGSRLNYAAHIFRERDPSEVAVRHASELRPVGEWTWEELEAQTAAVAAGLR
jgi:acetoacetyl-CoA synthetase